MNTVSNIKRKTGQWKWVDTSDIKNLGFWQPDHITTCCSYFANYSWCNLLRCAYEYAVGGPLLQG